VAGVACLAAGAILASNPVAHASCGDWLAHNGDGEALHDQMMAPGSHAESSRATDGVEGSSDLERGKTSCPCHGPHCDRSPTEPMPQPPVSRTVESDQLAVVSAGSDCDPSLAQLSYALATSTHPAKGFFLRIEHPPRA